ncbi:MAG: signal peptidase II [Ilumatobacteraceae bacterium]
MKTTTRGGLLALAVVVGDQLTKSWAVSTLGDGHVIDVFWTLRLALGYNSGFAFSTGTGWGPWIGLAAIGIVVALSVTLHKAESSTARWALSLIIGGAVGNIVDRLFREGGRMNGRVVDFIDFQWFPVFNIADSAITVGGVLLVLSSLVSTDSPSSADSEGDAESKR